MAIQFSNYLGDNVLQDDAMIASIVANRLTPFYLPTGDEEHI